MLNAAAFFFRVRSEGLALPYSCFSCKEIQDFADCILQVPFSSSHTMRMLFLLFMVVLSTDDTDWLAVNRLI